MSIPLWRRLTIALGALLIAGALFRGQLAVALIGRGDDAVRIGDSARAVGYYRRALTIDGRCVRAADRLAFYLVMQRTRVDAAAAVDVATAALEHAPDDAPLLADRALAEQRLRRWHAAEMDFARAAAVARDPRYAHFAGRVALVRGRPVEARRFFRVALALDPRFDPARAALASLR